MSEQNCGTCRDYTEFPGYESTGECLWPVRRALPSCMGYRLTWTVSREDGQMCRRWKKAKETAND